MTGWGRHGLELGAVSIAETEHVAGVLDHGGLKAQAEAQEGNPVGSGMRHRSYLALDAPDAEPPGDQDAVQIVQM